MRATRRFGLVGGVILALAVVFLVRIRREPKPLAEPAPAHAVAPPQAPGELRAKTDSRLPQLAPQAAQRASVAAPGALPHSLEDTEIDGWLGVDDDGHLVVTPGARWFFDYFLSATGEESPQQIRARIVAEIRKRLPPAGAEEAIALLERYLAYRERVRELQGSDAGDDLQQRLAQIHDIRVKTLGDADAAAMFGEEEQIQALDVQRRQVLADDSLSPDERERKIAEIDRQLPPEAREARAQAMTLVQLKADEEQLRAAGGSPADIHALRQQRFGGEAADRLDALDRERAEWQQRLSDYGTARDAIENDAALAPEARDKAIAALRAERFTPEEQVRVAALDGLQKASR